MTIRNATSTDFQAISKLHALTFLDIGQTAEEISKTLLISDLSLCFVVEVEHKIVGYLLSRIKNNLLYITWMVVSPEHTKKHYGSELLKAAEAVAKKNGVSAIQLHSRNRFKSALILYIKMGYQITSTHQAPDGDTMIRFEKEL